LVTIAPTLIGVPVAFVPGFDPHFVTSAAPAAFAVVVLPPLAPDDVDVLLLLLLPHAATTADRAMTSASAPSACRRPVQLKNILT
jgi:hypothetical protein